MWMALTDSGGNLRTTYTYGPFGQTAVAGASNDNPDQFHGRESEPMNGLYGGMYYFRARFLDTGLSRFVSRDSAGFQGGGHLYDYGGNAPADFNDPTGKCDVPGAFVGAALGVAGAVGTGGIKGNVPGIVVGGLVGAVVGCFDPFASEEAGSWSASGVSALSNFLASAAGQAAGKLRWPQIV